MVLLLYCCVCMYTSRFPACLPRSCLSEAGSPPPLQAPIVNKPLPPPAWYDCVLHVLQITHGASFINVWFSFFPAQGAALRGFRLTTGVPVAHFQSRLLLAGQAIGLSSIISPKSRQLLDHDDERVMGYSCCKHEP